MKIKAQKIDAVTQADRDRASFNHGYHDAAWDIRHDCERTMVEDGPHTPQTVSRAFNVFYFGGYAAGYADEKAGVYAGNSSAAWIKSGRTEIF